MKKFTVLFFLFLFVLLTAPICSSGLGQAIFSKKEASVKETEDVFRILDESSGKVTSFSAEDYLLGVLAAEVPVSYHEEALKAQAVASYTYACYKRQETGKQYDLTNDYTKDQSFWNAETRKSKWGSKEKENTEKLKKIIEQVKGQKILYQNQPILAAYHSLSSGNTESAKTVWGGEVAYLQSVPCEWDILSTDFSKTVHYTKEQWKKVLTDFSDEWDFDKKDLGEIQATETGFVRQITLSGVTMTGTRFRDCFSLNSAHFTVTNQSDGFDVVTYGKGHGVGMSQNAANEMAKEGKKYRDILQYFYQGCKISS